MEEHRDVVGAVDDDRLFVVVVPLLPLVDSVLLPRPLRTHGSHFERG